MFHAHSPASSSSATAGKIVLGRYRLGPRLGAGGMGVVYRARDARLDREVAVKVLMAAFLGRSDAARRFVEEARITAQL